MPSHTRATAGLVLVLVVAGCLGGPGGTPTADPTATSTPTGSPTHTPTASPTPTTSPEPASPTMTGTPVGWEYASEQPAPSHEVTLTNRWNRSVEIHVRVVREATNESVHEATYDLAAGSERTVYDTAAADPDGIERFTVTATALNATESVSVETSACYGNVHVEITGEGELYPYYAIC